MTKITREQRVALKRIYDRGPEWFGPEYPATYREFRKSVVLGFGCLMVRAGGMWLGIETDGYTHR